METDDLINYINGKANEEKFKDRNGNKGKKNKKKKTKPTGNLSTTSNYLCNTRWLSPGFMILDNRNLA